MWYNRVVSNFGEIPAFIDYYEQELIAARADVKIQGKVEKELSNLPGETEYRFNQLQEIEAVLEHLNIQLRKIRQKHYKKYLEAVIRNDGNRNAAARELEVARSTVYHHWKAHIATNPNPFEGQERKYSFRHIDGRHRRPIS